MTTCQFSGQEQETSSHQFSGQKQETSPYAARERVGVACRRKVRIDIVPGTLTAVSTNYGVRRPTQPDNTDVIE